MAPRQWTALIVSLVVLSTAECSTVSTFIQPDTGRLSVKENGAITCLDSATNVATPVIWSTTATSANLSSQNDLALAAFRLSELFLNNVDSGYCGQYTCTFNDSSVGASVTITVEPVFDESLMGHMILNESPGLEIIYTCTVNGTANDVINIVWSGPKVQPPPAVVETSEGIFTSSLILTNVTMFFSGVYRCNASYGNTLCTTNISSDARLDVIAPPLILFTSMSPRVVQRATSSIRFDIDFVAHPSFTDVECRGPSGIINNSSPGIATTGRINDDDNFQIRMDIHVFSVNYIHGGVYSCFANNSAGDIETSILLVVVPVVEPSQVLARDGDNITLMCLAQSTPEPSYLWERFLDSDDVDLIPDVFSSTLNITSGEGAIVVDPILTFQPIRYEDAGTYRCVVNINDGRQEVNVAANGILVAVSPEGSVEVSSLNETVLYDPNVAAALKCTARGGPDNSFQWLFNNQVIVNERAEILNLGEVEGGSYTCQVSNAAGSERATILITEAPHEVTVSSNRDRNIAALGGSAMLTCSNEGGPNNDYQWSKDGTILRNETGNILSLIGVTSAFGGVYNCTVSNSAGNASSGIVVIVSPMGSVEVSPAVIFANHSGEAAFNCSALGSPDNVFYWIRLSDGEIVANGSELTLVDIEASDGGVYRCVVQNAAGFGFENVTLNVSPLVTDHPQDKNVTIFEDSVILTCTAVGFPSPTITWFHNGSVEVNSSYITENVNYFTTRSTYSKLRAESDDTGGYFCVAAIEGYDNVNSNTVIVLVQDVPDIPENVSVLDIQSRSVTLAWNKPHDNNAPIEGYFVLYDQPAFAGGVTVVIPSSQEKVNLTELFPGVAYNFSVIAYNVIGNSSESNYSVQLTTLEEAPANSPQNLTSLALSSTTIYVSWEEVPPIDRNGIITMYKVLYEPLETFRQLSVEVANTTGLVLVLMELHPFVDYNISVRAYTSVGNGPYSDPIQERTLEDRPGMPLNVSAVANSSSAITVYWDEVPPFNRNGLILFYEVLYCSTLNCTEMASVNTTDATTFNLTLDNLEELTDYNITVRAYTVIGAGESTSAIVVTTLVKPPVITAVIPFDSVFMRGEIIVLMCFAIESFVDSYKWEKNGTILGSNDTLKVIADASSGGVYTCTVTNAQGSDSASTTLYVAPYFVTPLNATTLTESGSILNLNCDTAGFPTPTVKWVDSSDLTVSNTSVLDLSPVVFGDEGMYRCEAMSLINFTVFTVTDETTLIVSPEGSVFVSPLDVISSLGDSVSFGCSAMGGPNISFTWEMNGVLVGNDSVLNLMNIDASHGGDYICIVSNAAGTDSATATLFVTPYIVTPLNAQVLTTNGSSVNLNCDSAGFPAPNVTWTNALGDEVSNSSQLDFDPVIFGDEGLYQCTAFANINDTDFSVVDTTTLVVSPEGSAAATPLNPISNHGDNLTLVCTAMGGPGISFLWQVNENIVATESIVNLVNIDASNGGSYLCFVSNAAGFDFAVTTVFVAPYIVTPFDEHALTSTGSSINITCFADGFPAPNVRWVDALNLEVSNTSQLVINPVRFGDEGLYRCIASAEINGDSIIAIDNTTVIVSPSGSADVSPPIVIASQGNNATLTCTAMGGPGNSFTWERDGTMVEIDSMLNLVAIDASHGGTYTCNVSNIAGTDSTSATIYVTPYFETPLDDVILTVNGSSVDVFCDATGFPTPVVMWMNDLGTVVSSSPTLSLSTVVFGDEGLYTCVATSLINGSIYTAMDFTTITVSPEGSVSISPLNDVIASLNDNVTFLCTAMGGPNNTFMWEFNGNIISKEDEINLTAIDVSYGGDYTCTVYNAAGNESASTTLYVRPYFNTELDEQVSAALGSTVMINCDAVGFPAPSVYWEDLQGLRVSNTSELELSPIIFGDEGVYQCVATSTINGVAFTLTDQTIVTVSPEGSVTVSPLDVISNLGDSVSFGCSAMGGPNISFTWEMNGVLVGNDSVLNLMNIEASHGGDYTCIVSNAAGTDSATATLFVAPYFVNLLDSEILTTNGSNLNLNCDSAGFPPPNVTWTNMLGDEVSSLAQLDFAPVVFGDEGTYVCMASSEINGTIFTTTNQTIVIVSPEGSVEILPLNVTKFGDNVTLICSASGGPEISFLWDMNGENIVGNDRTLNLVDIDASYGGDYTCIVSNTAGTDSATATLYVAPYFVTSLDEELLATNGSSVNISCDAAGFPAPIVTWESMQGVKVSNTSSLEFEPAMFGDEGVYRCVASTEIDGMNFIAMAETTLTVSPAGSARIDRDNDVFSFGDNDSITCTAMGGPSLSFQWEMNGDIVGNDSMLNLVAIDASYGGTYTCTVSNSAGIDSISTVVYIEPYLVIPPDEQLLSSEGSTLNVTCVADGFPTPTVIWENSFGSIVSNSSQLEFDPVMFGDEGLYRCVAFSEINERQFEATAEATLFISPSGGISVDPISMNATHNSNVTFNCFALGGPQNMYFWTRDGDDAVISSEAELSLVEIQAFDGGEYQCSVENVAGEDNMTVTLNVSPVVIEHPEAQNVTIGEGTIQLTCVATGFPPPTISWFHNNTLEDENFYLTEDVNFFMTRSNLTKSMAQLNDSGSYLCRVFIDGFDEIVSNTAVILVQDTPQQPQNLTALDIQSRSLTFLWSEPHDNNAPIEGYYVVYSQPSFAGGELVVLNVSNETVAVDKLFPGVTYNFTVIAFNNLGNSTESELLPLKTLDEVPSSSPQNVSSLSLSSTAIQVTWEEIPQIDRNGEIIIHEVLYESQGTFYPVTSSAENTTDFSLLLMDLDPFTEYAISVRAYTSAGPGPYSNITLETTLEDAPSAPVNVTVTELGSTYAFIIWEAPEFPNGIIQNYIVSVTGSDGESVSNISTSNSSTNVTNLLPFTQYFVEVFAETVEVGLASDTISFNTSEAAPSSVRNLMAFFNDTHITITWDPPANPNGLVSYSISMTEIDLLSGESVMVFTDVVSEPGLVLEFLVMAHSEYTINVTSQTSAGVGETETYTFQTQQQAPSPPTNVSALEIAATYAIISWGAPEIPNGIIQTYIVSLMASDGQMLSNISTPEMSVNITNLTPFTSYYVAVRAETVDIGESSDNLSFRTQQSAPTSAQNLTAILINATHIFIRWDPPASPHGIVSYRVEVYETDLLSNDVIMIHSNQNVTELELLIEYSVRAYSLYTINVTSYTSAGSGTTATALIQTAEEEPSAPVNVTIIEIASTYILISWSPPEFPNGIIRSYTVSISDSGGQRLSNVSTNDLSANVTGLTPFTNYNVAVFARTVEIGEASPTISFMTSEESTFISIRVRPDLPVFAAGQNVTITCVDTGSNTPVNWTTTATLANLSNREAGFVSESVRESELHLINVDSGYCGMYTCAFANSDMTGSTYITVVPEFEISLTNTVITIESSNQLINLTCAVNGGAGNSVEIIWDGPSELANPTVVEASNGLFSSSLIITDATVFSSGIYQCTAKYSNILCPVNVSSSARINVIEGPTAIGIVVSHFVVDSGENISINFNFLSHPSFTDMRCIGPSGDEIVNTSSTTFIRVDNLDEFQINLLIDISPVQFAHGGFYTCTVNNTVDSIQVSSLIIVRPIVEPDQILAKNGDNVTLMCQAQSFPEPMYFWEMLTDSGAMADMYSRYELGSGGILATQPFLDFSPIQYDHSGLYRCIVSINGMFEAASYESVLSVSPEGSVVVEDENSVLLFNPNVATTLICTASGGPNNTYAWFFDGEEIEGSLSSSLFLSEVEGGEYTCQVSNAAGTETASIVITEAPHDVLVSSNVNANAASINGNVTLLCSNGGGPNNAYEWRKNGNIINSGTGNTLYLNGITLASGGNYSCTVTNAAGLDHTSITLYIAPYFVTPLEEEVSTFNGSNVTISCNPTGFPLPTVKWVDSLNIAVSNSSILEFTPALVRHEGSYRCIASINVNETEVSAVGETFLLVDSPTCQPEQVSANGITFSWPETNSGASATFTCPSNQLFVVSRMCIPGGRWDSFDQAGCGVLTTVFNNISTTSKNLTNETLVQTVEELSNLVEVAEMTPVEQSTQNLDNIANVLVNVATFVNESNTEINETVVEGVVEVLNSLTQWMPSALMANTTSQIVMSFETVASTFTQQLPMNMTVTIRTPFVTVTAENADTQALQITGRNLAFNDDQSTTDVAVMPGELAPQQEAAISLPASLFERVNDQESVGVFFAVYEMATLFPVTPAISNNNNNVNSTLETQVGSQVVAATVDSGQEITDLENPVTIVFRLQFNSSFEFLAPNSEMCVSWNFSVQRWTPSGCETIVGEDQIVTCQCNHLTNFAVLVDICLRQEDCQPSKVDDLLTYISYIGMPISIVCLILTIVTLLAFKKLRQKDISLYHVQLSLSLLLMLVVAFLLVVLSAEDVSTLYGGCLLISMLVHYFALVAILFMAAEALLMFRKLATPFSKITRNYNIIISAICWGIPTIPVLITLIVDLAGGTDPESDIVIRRNEDISFCFLSHVGAFWGAFLAPLLAIMLFNVVLFIFIAVVLIRHIRRRVLRKSEAGSGRKAIFRTTLSIFGLMCLFGLTWLFAILTFSSSGLREAFQVLFTLFNSFQGAFIFIFTCVLSSDAREGWKSVFAARKTDTMKLSHYSSYKSGTTSTTGSSTLLTGLSNTLLRSKKKKKRKSESIKSRTISISAALPEGEDQLDIISEESESDNEYQLQIKPSSSEQTNSNSNGVVMEMIAVIPTNNNKEFSVTPGEDVESSVTMFVNEGFIDVAESEMYEKPPDNGLLRGSSVAPSESSDKVECTFYDTDSEQEFQLQINPRRKRSKAKGASVAVMAVAKAPAPDQVVQSSAAVYVNASSQSYQPVASLSGRKCWRLVETKSRDE